MDLFQGENTTLYLTVLDGAAPVKQGISGTVVDVYHFDQGSLIFDVTNASMTQQAAPLENVWYYNYTVPSGAVTTTYNVIYNAMYSGIPIQASETFTVFPANASTNPVFFSGSVAVSGTVVDPSGVGIQYVVVSFASGNSIIATTTTNISGVYNANLNPQSYYTTFVADGYFTNQVIQTVPSGASYYFGLTTLMPNNVGSLTISDTLITIDINGNRTPLNNLKVVLWSVDTVAGGSPLATTYTNVSGTFFLNADPGNYILQIYGQDTNYHRFNQVRNIEVNSMYNNMPDGPFNFQYGDTSSYNFL